MHPAIGYGSIVFLTLWSGYWMLHTSGLGRWFFAAMLLIGVVALFYVIHLDRKIHRLTTKLKELEGIVPFHEDQKGKEDA